MFEGLHYTVLKSLSKLYLLYGEMEGPRMRAVIETGSYTKMVQIPIFLQQGVITNVCNMRGDRKMFTFYALEGWHIVIDSSVSPSVRLSGQTDGHLLGTKIPNKCPSVRTFHSFR